MPWAGFALMNRQADEKLKTIIKKALSMSLVAVMLASCNGSLSTAQAIPTVAVQTATSIVPTKAAKEEQTATPEAAPTVAMTTPTPDPKAVIPPSPNEQVYTDPDGWYVVNIPANMQPTDKPNVFQRPGNSFETGYLPEMGYMSNAANVLYWLTDLGFKPGQSTFEDKKAACPRPTNTNDAPVVEYQIRENPGADIEHRFIYIKTSNSLNDPKHHLNVTFSWLKPVSETRTETSQIPLSPEESSFWDNVGPMPSGISVTESNQPSLPVWNAQANPSPTPKKITIEELGYETRDTFRFHNDEGDFLVAELYKDGRPLLGYAVVDISDVYTFSTKSGRITAFIVQVDTGKGRKHFLIQNDAIRVWDAGELDSLFPPILYQNQLLWLGLQGAREEVKNSNGDVLCSFQKAGQLMDYPTFKTWNDHWIFGVDDFLVEDGVVLNQKFGFQEIFGWMLINDKPVYFFRKGARIGISYDGQILPLQYEEVTHGYMCCGAPPDGTEIFIDDNGLHFHGKRDHSWYYVEIKFK